MLLEVRNLTKTFGALVAINDLSFSVAEGEALGVMGPNGAGKSTLFDLIMGKHPPNKGEVFFDGNSITGAGIDQICHLGIGRTYQIPKPFHRMSVEDNLVVGKMYGHQKLPLPRARDEAREILDLVGLVPKALKTADDLGLLDRKRLELARALSTSPRLLLLDEIAGGLTEPEVEELNQILSALRKQGQSMILIEHVLRTLFSHSDRILALNFGAKVVEDTPARIVDNADVRSIYLGSSVDAAQPRTDKGATERDNAAEPILSVQSLSAGYGQFQALFGVSMDIRKGEVVALIGMNGAGKTTLTRAMTGQIPLMAGDVRWKGKSIAGVPAHRVVDLGISQCLEGRRTFGRMTVHENLSMGAFPRHARPQRDKTLGEIYSLFPRLAERRDQLCSTLSGGEQQMVAIGRALMALPELVIFDEISLGLAPRIIDQIYEAIPTIATSGVAILLIEQSIHRSLSVADRAYVIERGRITLGADVADLKDDAAFRAAYFGIQAEAVDEREILHDAEPAGH